MKAIKASDLRKKTAEELRVNLEEALNAQFKLRMQNGSGQLSQNHLLRIVKTNIARIKTVMHTTVMHKLLVNEES